MGCLVDSLSCWVYCISILWVPSHVDAVSETRIEIELDCWDESQRAEALIICLLEKGMVPFLLSI
jgi:hypothetical protein